MLADKRLLVTGVTTHRSIAFAVAREAQLAGAEIILTSFGRRRRMTERAAARLPAPPPILELDVSRPEDLAALAGEVDRRWGRLDGVVHSIGFTPAEGLTGDFLATSDEAAIEAFRISALSMRALAAALAPLMEKPDSASLVGLGFDSSLAWPNYDWMGVAKAGLESISRYLARDLGPRGIRVNLVSAGPLDTPAATGASAFPLLAAHWPTQAPLGWDSQDPTSVARAVCFFLSEWSSGVTGEILHVDGGYHAMGAPRLGKS
jgi:enoyl-[acyl-carrier protein] reductase I